MSGRTYRVWFGETFQPSEEVARGLAHFGAPLKWSATNWLPVEVADAALVESIVACLEDRQRQARLLYEDGGSPRTGLDDPHLVTVSQPSLTSTESTRNPPRTTSSTFPTSTTPPILDRMPAPAIETGSVSTLGGLAGAGLAGLVCSPTGPVALACAAVGASIGATVSTRVVDEIDRATGVVTDVTSAVGDGLAGAYDSIRRRVRWPPWCNVYWPVLKFWLIAGLVLLVVGFVVIDIT